jgi:hypothetical protein
LLPKAGTRSLRTSVPAKKIRAGEIAAYHENAEVNHSQLDPPLGPLLDPKGKVI